MSFDIITEEVELYLKVLLEGSSGTGKSHTSLLLANSLQKLLDIPRNKIGIIDSEYGRIKKKPKEMHEGFLYGVLKSPTLQDYQNALIALYKEDVKLAIIDSFSHAYDAYKTVGNLNGGGYTQWGNANKKWEELMGAINRVPMHIFATSRLDEKIEVNKNEDGKVSVVKLGLNPELKKNSAYDFDIRIRMSIEGSVHQAEILKDNNHWGLQNKIFENPGENIATIFAEKLNG